MKNATHIVLPLVTVIAFTALGFVAGRTATPNHAYHEFRTCYTNLNEIDHKLTPQCREYLKCRLYWHAALNIRKNALSQYSFDFGPVDEEVLGGIQGKMFDLSPLDVYNQAMRKHGQKGKTPNKRID